MKYVSYTFIRVITKNEENPAWGMCWREATAHTTPAAMSPEPARLVRGELGLRRGSRAPWWDRATGCTAFLHQDQPRASVGLGASQGLVESDKRCAPSALGAGVCMGSILSIISGDTWALPKAPSSEPLGGLLGPRSASRSPGWGVVLLWLSTHWVSAQDRCGTSGESWLHRPLLCSPCHPVLPPVTDTPSCVWPWRPMPASLGLTSTCFSW